MRGLVGKGGEVSLLASMLNLFFSCVGACSVYMYILSSGTH